MYILHEILPLNTVVILTNVQCDKMKIKYKNNSSTKVPSKIIKVDDNISNL